MSSYPIDLTRTVLETLKDVHNRGAALYNAGEHIAAYRIYQGGLIVAKAILAHHPQQQSTVQEGLEQTEHSQSDPKLKAFRLHEVIDQIRTELKSGMQKPADHDHPPAEAAVSGLVLFKGKPAANVSVGFVPSRSTKALATVRTGADGRFQFLSTLPVGTYQIILVGSEIPDLYAKSESTPIKAELKDGINSLTFETP